MQRLVERGLPGIELFHGVGDLPHLVQKRGSASCFSFLSAAISCDR